MKPTQELSREHQAIKVMLRIMGSACHKIEAGKDKVWISFE